MDVRRKPRSQRMWLAAGMVMTLLVLPAALQAQGRTAPAAPPGALGRWITASGNLEVEISPCGSALCGTVVQVLANRSMSDPGAPMTAVDARPVLGLQILTDFAPSGHGEWTGAIYNRENGKTYRCRMSVLDADRLEIRPYVGLPWFGKTQIWRRASGPARPGQ